MKSMQKQITIFAAAVFAAGLTGGHAWASAITYPVTVDTSAVTGSSGFLEFQFARGDLSTQASFITISNFSTTGTLIGAPDVEGGASGALPGKVTINNSTAFNDYFQGFTFGPSYTFQLTLDGPAIETPDGVAASGSTFGLGLYDSLQDPILTTDPSGFAAFVQVKLDGSTTPIVFPSNLNGGAPVVSFGAVPEPSTVGLSLIGVLAIVWRRRARRT